MSYVGLVPSEHSSGGKRHLGAITKAGNSRARRLLVESAHSYRYSANISTALQKRQENLSKEVIDIAWSAQQRLCRRFARLQHKGKHRSVIVAAIAKLLPMSGPLVVRSLCDPLTPKPDSPAYRRKTGLLC